MARLPALPNTATLVTAVVPVAVLLVVQRVPDETLLRAAAAAVVLGGVAIAIRRPDVTLATVVAVLPFHLVTLAALYRIGIPIGIVRPLGFWKEAAVAGIALAALRRIRTEGGVADGLDRLMLVYAAFVTMYLLLPDLFTPGAPTSLQARLNAYRADIVMPAAFLAARHAPIGAWACTWYRRAAVAGATVAATIGVYEFFASDAWNRFAVSTLQVNRYKYDILRTVVYNPFDVRTYGTIGGREFARIGSIQFNYGIAFYMLLGFSAVVLAILRRRSAPGAYAAGALIALTIVFTLTRSAVLGMLVICFTLLGFRGTYQQASPNRVRLVLCLVAALILLAPVAVGTGLTARTTGAFTGEDTSSEAHRLNLLGGFDAVVERPLGHGLGTAPGGERFSDTVQTAENAYLGVGVELGVGGMVLFLVLLGAGLARLRQIGRSAGAAAPLATVLFAFGVATAMIGMVLHVWGYEAALLFWLGTGLVTGVHDRASAPAPVAQYST